MLKAIVNTVIFQSRTTYVGRVQVHSEKGKYLYSSSTGIHRILKTDAKQDAKKLLKEMV